MACCAPSMLGQNTYPKIEWLAGYSAIETNDHTFQFRDIGPVSHLDFDERGKGFDTAVLVNLKRYLSIMGDISAHFSSNQFPVPIATTNQNGTINPRLINFHAGSEIKWRNHTRIAPFAHALFGIAHSTATFSTAGSVINLSRTDAETGFAMAYGGGFDLRIIRRAGFRGFLTYRRALVGSSLLPHQSVNAVGWSAGVLFH